MAFFEILVSGYQEVTSLTVELGRPASACLSIAMIWRSVKRGLRMWSLISSSGYKIPLISSIIFRGDYRIIKYPIILGEINKTGRALGDFINAEYDIRNS